MKKQLLAIALLAAGVATAQTWTQNFSTATPPGLPAGWMQNNVDGLTTATTIAAYQFTSCPGGCAGVTRNVTSAFSLPAMYGNALITTSRYTPAGTSDDWVITPQFTVPNDAVFNWDATSFDPASQNAYEIRISTTGTTPANFNANPALFTIAAETYSPSAWIQRGVGLGAYAGQQVYLAVHEISNNKWQLALDNFSVTVPANANDGQIVSVNGLTRYMAGAGNQNIQGTFKQLGFATATTAVINYNVNNGTPVSQTFTFSPTVPYFGTNNFLFTTPANLPLGANQIKVWVSDVNGNAEVNLSNDTAYQVVYVATQSVTINALIEEFTSSTCGPCASLNNTFDPLLASNNVNLPGSNLNAIKYQVNWPSPGNDPSYNPDVLTRRNYYAVNSAPTVLYNGVAGSGNQTNINISKTAPAYFNITPQIDWNNQVVTANATITPFVTVPATSPLRIYQALVQSEYHYPGASTSQKYYKHAMRKMFPAAGTTYTTTAGTPFTVNFNHTLTYGNTSSGTPAQGSFNFWHSSVVNYTYEYIVWVQDIVSKQVLQSGAAFTTSMTTTGLVEFAEGSSIGVYPNPANEYAVIGLKLNNSSAVDVKIIDITGKVVYNNKAEEVFPGSNEISVNTADFAAGTYHIIVTTNDGILKDKLIIVK